MFVYVYLARARSPEDARAVCFLFGHLLQLIQAVGYIRGDCALGVHDPRQVVVHEYWGSLPALRFWLDSADHRRALQEAETHLDGPPRIEVFEVQA